MLILWAAPPIAMAGDQQSPGSRYRAEQIKQIDHVTRLQRKILKMPTLEEEQAAYAKAHRSPKVKHK